MEDRPVFRDRNRPPDRETLAGAIGASIVRWDELAGMAAEMGAAGEWVWNGAKEGWGFRMKRSGRPFLMLAPRPGAFRALVVLGREQSVAAAVLPLGPGMRATYDAANQYPDGRWLFHVVETDEDVRDILTLLRLKLPPTIRARFVALAQTR